MVLTCDDVNASTLAGLANECGLHLEWVAPGEDIPGSYWGEPEAGLIDDRLMVRTDTPVHSALHEACHYACMPQERRSGLHTDAGGGYAEENGVCYLQILLAARLPEMGLGRMCADMDTWGYTFRLGSAGAWFERDADDAREWLLHRGLLDAGNAPRLPGRPLSRPTRMAKAFGIQK